MKSVRLLLAIAILSLSGGLAVADGPSHVNCIMYQGYDGSNYVQGSLVRSANPGVWLETNTENSGANSLQVMSESPRELILLKPNSAQIRIRFERRSFDYRNSPDADWVQLYAVVYTQ